MRKILLKEHKKLKILLIVLKQYSFFLNVYGYSDKYSFYHQNKTQEKGCKILEL